MSLFEDLNALVAEKLVVRKDYDDGLCLFKYHNKVHWKKLWRLSPALIRARGIVFTKEGELVCNPLPKVFYLGENGTKVDRDAQVVAVRKINGFMASVFPYKNSVRIATTGTLDSAYVELAREKLGPYLEYEHDMFTFADGPRRTSSYEIVHEKDPHIVPELPGVYILNGHGTYGMHAPEMLCGRMSDILAYSKQCKHEGWVIRDPDTDAILCKIKTPYYLGLKLMARGKFFYNAETGEEGKEKLRTQVDEEFYPMIDEIYDSYGIENFRSLEEQAKLELMRELLTKESMASD